MLKEEKEKIIRIYFDMWIHRNFDNLDRIFHYDIYYSECYGPEYQGLSEVYLWIDEMVGKQRVLEWTIKRFLHQENSVVVEWFFKDLTDGNMSFRNAEAHRDCREAKKCLQKSHIGTESKIRTCNCLISAHFLQKSSHSFYMGNEQQVDLIMMKELEKYCNLYINN